MTVWTIRTARIGDAETVVALEALAFGAASWGAMAVADGLTAPHVSTLLAFPDDARAAKAFAFYRLFAEEAEILSIGVSPSLRRCGGARALLTEIIERARADGARKLFLEVATANIAAATLYRSAGFEQIGRRDRYYKNGGDALVMRINL